MDEYKLIDLLTYTRDGEWGKGEPTNGYVLMSVIRGTDFEKVRFGDLSTVPNRYIREDIANRKMLKPGDILIETAGGTKDQPTGRTVYLNDSVFLNARNPVTCASFSRFLRVKENIVDPKFLFWALQDKYKSNDLLPFHIQHTGVARFQFTDFSKSFPFSLPDYKKQIKIAGILSSLDDKIDLNRRMNETLEAMARAIFKDWFVDFGPTRAKMEGRAPYLAQEIWDLFPDALDDEGKPVRWEEKKIDDFITRLPVGKKFDQKTVSKAGKVPVLDQGKEGVIGYHSEEPGVHASLDNPVVVFANHTCNMRIATFDFSTIQNVLPFIGQGVDTVWAYYASSGKQKFIEYKGHWPDFIIHKAVCPSFHFTKQFRGLIDPFLRKVVQNNLESRTLAQTRDLLLPKLMSGEIRVKDAEKTVEQAL